jgi:ABC-type phosphate transport system substrate-binding protein
LKWIRNISCCIVFCWSLIAGSLPVEFNGLSVIVNPDVPVSELNKKELLKIIFGEQQRWEDGSTVKIGLLRTNNEIGLKVANEVFEMNSNEFNKYWLGLVFEGKCKAPAFFLSEEDLVKHISQTKGSIGIVSTKAAKTGVKQIKIIGE